MKLIITIVPKSDSDSVSLALTDKNYRVTQIASTGGFLHKGNATLLIGLEDEQVDDALGIIRETVNKSASKQRGVVFVIKVDKFIHF